MGSFSFRAAAITLMMSIEWPPSSKKLSPVPTRSRPRVCSHSPAMSFSVPVTGAV